MAENEKIEWESWGIQMMDGMKHQKDPWVCPFCGYEVDFGPDAFDSFIVGFCKEEKLSFHECSKCFKKFYRHIEDAGFNFITRHSMRDETFLKVPGAQEEFLQMLKEQEEKKKSQR